VGAISRKPMEIETPFQRTIEMTYGKLNGHVTDDVTWPQKLKLVTPVCLERNISKKLDMLFFQSLTA